MGDLGPGGNADSQACRIGRRNGRSPVVLVCDHASNHIPPQFRSLGLTTADLARHIAWDPGAAPVARQVSELLDATLIEASVSRLVIDCNRPLHAPDLIAEVSETTRVPGNAGLTPEQREQRVVIAYEPYHRAIEGLVAERAGQGRKTCLVAVHSFNPVYRGVSRPWQIGVLHDGEMRIAGPLLAALSQQDGLKVGDNQPYSPADLVYYTLERHARARGLPCVMIEIRNDEIAAPEDQRRWAQLLARLLGEIAESPATWQPLPEQRHAPAGAAEH